MATISMLARRAGIGGSTLAVIEQLEQHSEAYVPPQLDRATLDYDMALADTARALKYAYPDRWEDVLRVMVAGRPK